MDPNQKQQPEVQPERRELVIQPLTLTETPPAPVPEPEPIPTVSPEEMLSAAPDLPSEVPSAAPVQQGPVVPDPTILPPVKDNKAKGIIVGSILALVVLGGGAFGWYYFTNMYVSADDYKAVSNHINEIGKASSVSGLASSITGTEPEQLTTAYATLKDKNAQLADLRALKVDSNLRVKYDAYKQKMDTFLTFMDKAVPSIVAFNKAAAAAKDYTSGTTVTSADIQKVLDTYAAIGDIPDPSIKQAVDVAVGAYQQMLANTQTIESTASYSKKMAAVNAMQAIVPKLTSDLATVKSQFDDRLAAVSPVAAMNDLAAAVTAKTSKS